jgi:hypothetical protein
MQQRCASRFGGGQASQPVHTGCPMRDHKLRLNIDDLAVESFAPAAEVGERGTVRGAEATADGQTLCALTQCEVSYCIDNTCEFTQCDDLSCYNGGECGGGGAGTQAQNTCNVRCHTNPGIE